VSIKMAINNWKNFARQVVGLPKTYPVRIVRNEAARKYPLMAVKKAGDVGYDLPSTERVVIPAATPEAVANYHRCMKNAAISQYGQRYDLDELAHWRDKAMSYLPKAIVKTGIRLEMPDNIWSTIAARSSSSSKLLITPDSVIDAGYRGELFAVVFNLGYADYVVEEGERLVQVIFHERVLATLEEVDELNGSERGETGFGSTGKK
jgi:dUTP pyrophosphatase